MNRHGIGALFYFLRLYAIICGLVASDGSRMRLS